ncbi:unnamed protein product [Pleuronectes platessa]|uniref:Uncharacterized protein n=1 Tax=Pleuronectes platessa TaxID=8262 RepID=A0A9N7YKE8_PLEPL|nr:unnamed protein product [Pleuronectes platessa]
MNGSRRGLLPQRRTDVCDTTEPLPHARPDGTTSTGPIKHFSGAQSAEKIGKVCRTVSRSNGVVDRAGWGAGAGLGYRLEERGDEAVQLEGERWRNRDQEKIERWSRE